MRIRGITDLSALDCSCATVAGLSNAEWGVSTHPTEDIVVSPVLVRQRFNSLSPIEISHYISMSTGRGLREPRVGLEQQRHAAEQPRCDDRITIGRESAMAGTQSERARAPGGGRDPNKMRTFESSIGTVTLFNIKTPFQTLCALPLGSAYALPLW